MLDARRDFVRTLSPGRRVALEEQLLHRIMPHLGTPKAVAGYHAMTHEIDPSPILAALAVTGCVIGLPWFANRDARIVFRQAPAVDPGPWNIMQPPGDAAIVAPDIVLVPLVAADRRGNRIGHGMGHYDRALADLQTGKPVRTIGLAWSVQIVDDITADVWDVPLDAVATPDQWFTRMNA